MEGAFRAALACLPQMNVLALPRLLCLAGGARELWDILKAGGGRAAALAGGERAAMWKEHCALTDPSGALAQLARRGIRIITPEDDSFPERLGSIYDPPALLFARGLELPADAPFVAVVGARKASGYGRWAAEAIAGELARRGVVVVSGAAYGVDGHAHQGCLAAGGFTVAVLGCGIDRIYPPGHASLMARIKASGCLLSEYAPGEGPLPWRFPHRNRIIAGLSHAVLVVEACEKSGALITADMALEEGREVMAVPGPIGSSLSRGTNALIQKGAKLVMSVEDICEELPSFRPLAPVRGGSLATAETATGAMDERESTCAEMLQGGPQSLDWLAAHMDAAPGELLSLLASMALKGWVCEEPGGRYRFLFKPDCGRNVD